MLWVDGLEARMRRWLRYNAPVMVLVEMAGDDEEYEGQTDERVIKVVLAADRGEIELARDFRGHLLFYDEAMQPVPGDSQADDHALWIADYGPWPDRHDWEEGPDPLHWPGLYDDDPDPADDDLDNEDDLDDEDDPYGP